MDYHDQEIAMNDETEDHKNWAEAWFKELRDRICTAFESIEDDLAGSNMPAGRFERTSWDRAEGARRAYSNRRDRPGSIISIRSI